MVDDLERIALEAISASLGHRWEGKETEVVADIGGIVRDALGSHCQVSSYALIARRAFEERGIL